MLILLLQPGTIFFASKFFKIYEDPDYVNFFQFLSRNEFKIIAAKENFDYTQIKHMEALKFHLESEIKNNFLKNII